MTFFFTVFTPGSIRSFLTVCCFVALCQGLRAQQVWDVYGEPEKGMTVTGVMKGEGASGGSIKIYRDGKFYLEVFAGSTGKYEADLPFNSQYELEFSMPGCVTKKIKVETNLPAASQDQVIEPLAFNMSLPKATNGPLDEAYTVPVSRLYFDKGIGDFNRDMVTEEAFRNMLKSKQAEQKRWLEEQKSKEDLDKQKKREEDLAKKKAEDAATADAARQKAAEEARIRAEQEAKKQADAAAAKKAQEEAPRKAQEDALVKKHQDEEFRKREELRRRNEADSLYRINEKIRLEKEALAREAEKKKQEAADLALWEKMNDRKAALEMERQKAVQDSLFKAEQRNRAQREDAEKAGAERRKREADELAYNERMVKKAQAMEDERRRREISDSLYNANARLQQEAEARKRQEEEEARNAARETAEATYTGGGGRSVFYRMEEAKARPKDAGAVDRAANWERKREERRSAYLARIQRHREEGERLKIYDSRKEREFMEKRRLIEERRLAVAERNRLRDEEAERLRKARLQESLDKKIVILVAYSSGSTQNPNAKFYGYVNFGDGKGPLELTESEYKELSRNYNGIYNKP